MPATQPPPYSLKKQLPEFSSEGLDTGIYPYLQVLKNRKGVLIACVFFTVAVALVTNLTQRPVYQATAELLLQPKASQMDPSARTANAVLQDPTLLLTQFRMIRSPHLASKVLERLERPENRAALLDCYSVRPSRRKKNEEGVFSAKERQILAGRIQGSITPRQPDRGVRILTISVAGYNPSMVAQLANTAAEVYNEMNYQSDMDAFRQNFLMMSKSLAEIREKIKTGEFTFQKIDSEVKLLEALKIYEEKHPLVIQLRADIPQLADKLKYEIQNLAALQLRQRPDLVPLLTTPHVTFEDLHKIEADLHILKPILEQELNTNREMYNSLFRKFQEVEISGAGSIWLDPIVVEPAGAPSRPIRPNKKLNLIIGFFVGLFLGTGLTFFLEYLDSSVRSLEDVRTYLKLFPLGMIPYVEFNTSSSNGEKASGVSKPSQAMNVRPFWLADNPGIPLYVAEAYRIVRTNLAFGSVDTTLKVLQVTSAVKGEGKTTTAANLGVSLALAGSRTLLIDADLRRPTLHRILGMERTEGGLSAALANGKSWESLAIQTEIPNLFFLDAGIIPPNPAELLSSKRMKAFIDELREHFEMVIIDSPPVVSVADATIIATRVDGTILVSRSAFAPRHLCLQAKHALESVNGKLVGCVLNSVQTRHQPYYYQQYYRQYGRYHEDAQEKSSQEMGEDPVSLSSETLEKMRALQEPFLIFLAASWSRLMALLKWKPPSRKESKSSVGAPQ